MHPILARGGRLALYLALWGLVGGLLTLLLAGRTGLTWLQAAIIAFPVASAYAFVCLSSWYVARGLPIVTTGPARVLATGILASLLSSAGWLALSHGWVSLLVRRGSFPPAARGGGHDSLIFGVGILLYLLSLAVSYLLIAFDTAREAEQRALQGQVFARDAELRSLRSQIDPHFLFNCLHSISALTALNPAAARRMCLLLAEFFRETLALGGEKRIPLARELALVARFLEVERIRFGDRLDIVVDAAAAAQDCLLPPLLLQPIVENAVTHGIAHLLERGTIRIVTARAAGRVSIVVENPCDADRPRRTGTGVGLSNVRSRLHTLYGAEATVSASEQNGLWRVELSFPAIVAAALEPA